MQNGMILKNPTIFGAANGRLLGGGEAGHEAIVGVNSLQSMIAAAVRTQALDPERIYEAVRQGASGATVTAYMDGRSVTNIVNRVNAMTAGQRTRLQGAY